MKFDNILDYAKFGILTISLCGTTALTTNYMLQKNNEKVIEKIDTEIHGEMVYIHSYIEHAMIKNLVKQSKKIQTNPADIKMIDIEQVLSDWAVIKDQTFYQKDYDIVKNWYIKQIEQLPEDIING